MKIMTPRWQGHGCDEDGDAKMSSATTGRRQRRRPRPWWSRTCCFFALPQERKDALRMTNSPHFLGYSPLGVEHTRGVVDQREQSDLAMPLENGKVAGPPASLL